MSKEIRTVATFHITCNLPFGTPCEHHNCCHFVQASLDNTHLEPKITFCEHAQPSESHIDCKEIE